MAFDQRDHLMSIPQNEIPDSSAIPGGHYYGQIMSYEFGRTPWNDASEALFYKVQLTEPGEDIEPSQINGVDLRELDLRPVSYEIIPSRMKAIKRLHASLGLNPANTTDANVPEAVGKRVLCTVNAKPSNREGDDTIYNNIVFMVGVPD